MFLRNISFELDARGAKKKAQGDMLPVDPDATPELKEGVEVSPKSSAIIRS